MKYCVILFICLCSLAHSQNEPSISNFRRDSDQSLLITTKSDSAIVEINVEKIDMDREKVSSYKVCLINKEGKVVKCWDNPVKGIQYNFKPGKGVFKIKSVIERLGNEMQVEQIQQKTDISSKVRDRAFRLLDNGQVICMDKRTNFNVEIKVSIH